MQNSTTRQSARKAGSRVSKAPSETPAPKIQKPRPDFPLFPHATGRWAKKVKGKMLYFGKVADDPLGEKALETWLDQKDAILAGRKPRVPGAGYSVRNAVNDFLNAKRVLLQSGELTPRTFAEYMRVGKRIADVIGRTRLVLDLDAEDFRGLRAAIARHYGPVALGNEIQRVRTIFKHAYDNGRIERPVRFGSEFKKPSASVIRKARARAGLRMFEAEELRRILAAAGQPMKAMVLLAANCGFGQTDIANLPAAALDLEAGWVNYPRPKTGVDRRCPLWPETIAAMREAIPMRPKPADPAHAGMVFITPRGHLWARSRKTDRDTASISDAIGVEFRKLLAALDINGKRAFYAVRHGFQTIAEEAGDLPAVKYIMGHVDATMSGTYRERFSDARLRAVVDHVHGWLWPKVAVTLPPEPDRA